MKKVIKAGTMMSYARCDDTTLIIILLKDRDDESVSNPCLIIGGRVYGRSIGDIVMLRGIVDLSEEVVDP